MKVRNKSTGTEGISGGFNTHGTGEIIVYYNEGDCSSEFITDFEVFINNTWVDLHSAFACNALITDNYNTRFFEPKNWSDYKRGYTDR